MSSSDNGQLHPCDHHVQPYGLAPYISVKTENDAAYCRPASNQYHAESFSVSPHGYSSCMYASSVSPCSQSMASPDLCGSSIGSYKENSGLRSSPACRRRLDFNHNAFVDVTKLGPGTVAKRNERERNRVKLINMTFHTLRQHLPLHGSGTKGKSRKLSKVQTLRSAIDYIRQLQDLVDTKHMQIGFSARLAGPGAPGDAKDEMRQSFREFGSRSRCATDKERYLLCQSPCSDMVATCSLDHVSKRDVSSPLCRQEKTDSPMTTCSNEASPFSDASYDVISSHDNDQLVDFVDWF